MVGWSFRLLSGDDASALAYFSQGGNGCISVTSNVAPGLCRNMYLAWKQNQITRAQRLAGDLAKLTAALLIETNPAPVKYALSLINLMSSSVRLPLVDLTRESKTEIAEVLAQMYNGYSADMIGHHCGRKSHGYEFASTERL
jgi:4-hydroxy-tetrahydrodipicolinate synthase